MKWLSTTQSEVLHDEISRHRWVSSGGPKYTVICGCGERVSGVPDRGINMKCPQAVRLASAFGLRP